MDGEQQKCISRHVGQEILRPYFKPLHSWMGFHRLPPSPSKNCLLLTVSGKDSSDAKRYQEKDVQQAIKEVEKQQENQEDEQI
ncbi:hypothetical protein NIES4075_00120 [Tolypothrix sp. NIES-4075]|nr:hypothetical protein NIES4075_00120 [Tolypothrix sp. NIES-4075]